MIDSILALPGLLVAVLGMLCIVKREFWVGVPLSLCGLYLVSFTGALVASIPH